MIGRTILASLILAAGSPAVAAPAWPELPRDGFIGSRVATPEDVSAGAAAFSQSGHPMARPTTLAIPQYACHRGEEPFGRVVLIQAEDGVVGRIVGLKLADGSLAAALANEITLLGTAKPDDKECL